MPVKFYYFRCLLKWPIHLTNIDRRPDYQSIRHTGQFITISLSQPTGEFVAPVTHHTVKSS